METVKILIVEDDTDISNMLRDLLEQNGWQGVQAFSGTEALLHLAHAGGEFRLVLLDLMLPGKSGAEVLRELRAGPFAALPVIAVTAVGATASKVELLGQGADDYVTKPFDNEELIARIAVQLRKQTLLTHPPAGEDNILRHGALSLDTQSLAAAVNGKALGLTRRELEILRLLMESPRKVFTKGNIYESVWGEEFWGDENTVNVHISNLRTKITKLDPTNEYIQTIWGIGFKMKDL